MTATARDIMNPEVISVSADMDLRDLAKLFLEKGITGAPVVDENGDLAGVISQTDLIYYNLTRDDELVLDSDFYQAARVEGQHIPRGFQIEDTNTGRVADVMTPLVHSVTERATIDAVTRMMTRKHIHRVIVRRGRKIAGIISALDLLRAHDGEAEAASAPRVTARHTAARGRSAPAGRKKAAAEPRARSRTRRSR